MRSTIMVKVTKSEGKRRRRDSSAEVGQQTAKSRSKYQQKWNARFKELKGYRKKQGNCNVPKAKPQLGEWVQTQRQNYRKGKLSAERVRCLEELGFKWDQRHVLGSRKARDLVDQQKWDTQFTQLTMGSMGTIMSL